MIYIYILLDPTDNSIHYCGKTDNPQRRMKEHLTRRYKKSHVSRWIGLLFDKAIIPAMEIVDICSSKEEEEIERFWISFLLQQGHNLANMTPGGDGGRGFKMKEGQKEKIRNSLLGKKHTEERKKNISLAHQGKTLKEEHKKKLSISSKEMWKLDSHKKKIQQSMISKLNGSYMDKNGVRRFYGVSEIKGRWRAYITVNRKQISLGFFDSFEEACDARKRGEEKYRPSFPSKSL